MSLDIASSVKVSVTSEEHKHTSYISSTDFTRNNDDDLPYQYMSSSAFEDDTLPQFSSQVQSLLSEEPTENSEQVGLKVTSANSYLSHPRLSHIEHYTMKRQETNVRSHLTSAFMGIEPSRWQFLTTKLSIETFFILHVPKNKKASKDKIRSLLLYCFQKFLDESIDDSDINIEEKSTYFRVSFAEDTAEALKLFHHEKMLDEFIVYVNFYLSRELGASQKDFITRSISSFDIYVFLFLLTTLSLFVYSYLCFYKDSDFIAGTYCVCAGTHFALLGILYVAANFPLKHTNAFFGADICRMASFSDRSWWVLFACMQIYSLMSVIGMFIHMFDDHGFDNLPLYFYIFTILIGIAGNISAAYFVGSILDFIGAVTQHYIYVSQFIIIVWLINSSNVLVNYYTGEIELITLLCFSFFSVFFLGIAGCMLIVQNPVLSGQLEWCGFILSLTLVVLYGYMVHFHDL